VILRASAREEPRGKPGAEPGPLVALSLVLGTGLALRVALANVAPIFLEGDSQSYLLPAWQLLHGDGFSPELRRTPGYPLLIAAAFRALGEDLQSLALAQHALGLATAILTYVIGQRLFGRAAGLLAAAAVAVSGPQLIYERYLMTEALFGFALAVVGLALVTALRRPTPQALLFVGLSVGLAALTRPVAQAILPLAFAAFLALLPRWRPALRAVGLTLAGFALIVAPWMLRNVAAHDTPAASGGLGRSLIARTVKYDNLVDWKWLSETYGGRDDLPARERMLLYRKRGNIPEGRSVRPYQDSLIRDLGLSQGQAESAMRDIGLEAIGRRPLDYARGSLLFTLQLFLGRDELFQSHWKQRASKDWSEQWDDRLDFLVAPIAPQQVQGQATAAALTDLYQPARLGWALLALFGAGCLLAVREPARRPALLLAGIVLTLLTFSAFLDGPVPRYRYPLDPLIAVLASGGLVRGLRATWALRRRPGTATDLAVSESPLPQVPIPSPPPRGLG
jgi:4-amino-4-deoxy-L-arabinose transferase-like glycosyltransferase